MTAPDPDTDRTDPDRATVDPADPDRPDPADTDRAAVDRFHDAFGRGDVAAVMACMTEDCVFESTGPAPDGTRFEGAAAVREVFAEFFATNPAMRFDTEQQLVWPGWAVVQWRYWWSETGSVRGIDLMRLDGGKVAAKHSYVKG